MSYPDIYKEGDSTGAKFLEDLLSRKEFFSLKMDPQHNFRDVHDDQFIGKYLKIHAHQLFVRNFMNPDTPYTRLHLMHGTGCHARDTKILMYDGRVKFVQNIEIGDWLMGDDGSPRIVHKLHKGREMMYRCNQSTGEQYIFNESHILTVTDGNDTVDLPLSAYMKCSDRDKWMLPHHGAMFTEKNPLLRPYLWAYYADKFRMTKIPYRYRCGSRPERCKLLGGFVDKRVNYYHNETSLMIPRVGPIDDDILFVARSLGLCADYNVDYIMIQGNICMIESKKFKLRVAAAIRSATFKIEPLYVDEYYGFTLDGNGRFLGADFTVLHNSGKTLAAISVAQSFISVYKKIYASVAAKYQNVKKHYVEIDKVTPSVFVLGFGGTKMAFVNELLSHPELGFVTVGEREELVQRQRAANAGHPDDIRRYKELIGALRKRIVNKMRDGFYKFYGYDEFVNKLFSFDEIKLTDIEAEANAGVRSGSTKTLEDIIKDYIKQRKIRINQSFVEQFDNSLIICDEIHNTYNTNMKNNRGVAIQYVVDTVPTVRLLTLSATPINNSPTEIVELVNYLVPVGSKITKQDIFTNMRALKPDGLQKLTTLVRGKFSFLQDVNPKYFPERIFMGETLRMPHDVDVLRMGEPIPYFKFVECPMSEFHQETYNHHILNVREGRLTEVVEIADIEPVKSASKPKTASKVNPSDASVEQIKSADSEQIVPIGYEDVDEELFSTDQYSYHSIPNDGYSIYDMVFPNPLSDDYGLYRSGETKNELMNAPQAWRDKHGIYTRKFSVLNYLITGQFLQRDNLAKYSTKYTKMVDIIHQSLSAARGDIQYCKKIMIYHDRVKMSGVLIIQEILKSNGILDEYSEPIDGTLCMRCGRDMQWHNVNLRPGADGEFTATEVDGIANHQFRACRFIMAHSDMEKVQMDQALVKYNSPDNKFGEQFTILVGSKIIKESFNFKAVQEYIITSLPVNIPTLIQVLGRCIRKNSHAGLPAHARRVQIHLLVSTFNKSVRNLDTTALSPELYRYVDKILDYEVIQRIEAEINKNAIDADIHRDIVMSTDLKKTYFPNWPSTEGGPVKILGNLYFDPAYSLPPITAADLNLSTFTAYKYGIEEARQCATLIKQLFMYQQVWVYSDLWENVRRPPVGIEINPALISEQSFVIALTHLITPAPTTITVGTAAETLFMERLFDYNDKFVYIDNIKHQIMQIDRFYIAFPVANEGVNPFGINREESGSHIRDKERLQIHIADVRAINSGVRPVVDVETYVRRVENKPGVRISLNAYVNGIKDASAELSHKLEKFIARYNDANIHVYDFITDYTIEFQKYIASQIVLYKINPQGTVPAFDRIYEFLNNLRIFVNIEEVKKYKEVAKSFKTDLQKYENIPIGFVSAKTIKLYDIDQAVWFEVNKLTMNRMSSFKENEIIVGYIETFDDGCKFKLRKPVQYIRDDINRDAERRRVTKSESSMSNRAVVADTRLIERGIVCGTKNKTELLQIISNLGISLSEVDRGEIRIKNLCNIIRNRLIESEIAERQKDSRWKYMYLFDAEMPVLGV